jgi:polar amino acid transport system ATP-binding protein
VEANAGHRSDGPMLRLDQVHKSFGDLHVLRGVDLQVDRGGVVCVIGPSGSGKSTLLRCINLLEPPDGGHIYLDRVPAVQPVPAHDRRAQRVDRAAHGAWTLAAGG